jgi:hypothetical protein
MQKQYRRRCPSGPGPFVPKVGPARAGPHPKEDPVTLYAALIYTADVDWSAPEHAEETAEYGVFGQAAAAVIRGGAALYPTSTATTVRVAGGKDGELVTTDGPYAETKEVLNGFYLLECADLDDAVATAARIPAAWTGGTVEVRPVIPMG